MWHPFRRSSPPSGAKAKRKVTPLTRQQQRTVARTIRPGKPNQIQVTFRLQHRGRALVVVAWLVFDVVVLLLPWVVGAVALLRHVAG